MTDLLNPRDACKIELTKQFGAVGEGRVDYAHDTNAPRTPGQIDIDSVQRKDGTASCTFSVAAAKAGEISGGTVNPGPSETGATSVNPRKLEVPLSGGGPR